MRGAPDSGPESGRRLGCPSHTHHSQFHHLRFKLTVRTLDISPEMTSGLDLAMVRSLVLSKAVPRFLEAVQQRLAGAGPGFRLMQSELSDVLFPQVRETKHPTTTRCACSGKGRYTSQTWGELSQMQKRRSAMRFSTFEGLSDCRIANIADIIDHACWQELRWNIMYIHITLSHTLSHSI